MNNALRDAFPSFATLQSLIEDKPKLLEEWLLKQGIGGKMPFYSSIDCRFNAYKTAPVDANLFPAGFNNLNQQSALNCAQCLAFTGLKVLIITENFQRNNHYHDNLVKLSHIIGNRQNEVRLGNHELTERLEIPEQQLTIYALASNNAGSIITEDGYEPDLIILNNDLMTGMPDLLANTTQKILPSPQHGWYCRSKYRHQVEYAKLAEDFGATFKIDPWLISTEFDICDNVIFKDQFNIELLAEKVQRLIDKIKVKYDDYSIKYRPHVFLKADQGTYGMGVITAYSGEAVINANKKARKKMYTTKGNRAITTIYLQEGVPTEDLHQNLYSEPIVYNMGANPVAILLRYNANKGAYENLNSPGAGFVDISTECRPVYRKTLELTSKMAVIAASRELPEAYNPAHNDSSCQGITGGTQ